MFQCYSPIYNDCQQLVVHCAENHILFVSICFFLQEFYVYMVVFKMPLASSVSFKNKGNLHTYKTYSLRSNVAVSSDWIQKQCASPDHKPREFHV